MKNFKINSLRVIALTVLVVVASSFKTINHYRHIFKIAVGTSKENDTQFLIHAAEINLEEIKLAQLAQTRSMLVDVKELGKMMENVHSKSMRQLTSLARKKDITIPMMATFNVKESYRNLEKKSEENFDKAFCKLMVDGHQKAIELFEKAAKDSEDMDIRKWAEDTLPALRADLAQAVACQEKCER